jgi:excinuclease UvrABC nuclease subunit
MLPLSQVKDLPVASGIYLVLAGDGCVIYIGQSINIRDRWQQGHHKMAALLARDDFSEMQIRWVYVPSWLLNRAENAAISFYQPVLNCRMPPVV